MFKKRKSQLFLILAVIALTIYNILPTVFYYAKPLHRPVSESQAKEIAKKIAKRADALEEEALAWASSFCDLLRIKPAAISAEGPGEIRVRFASSEEALRFRAHAHRAGASMSFAPAQMTAEVGEESDREVFLRRKVHVRLQEHPEAMVYVAKESDAARALIQGRAKTLASMLGGESETSLWVRALESGSPAPLELLAQQILVASELCEDEIAIGSRLAAHLMQGTQDRALSLQKLIEAIDRFRDAHKQEEKETLILQKAKNALKKWKTQFMSGAEPWSEEKAPAEQAPQGQIASGVDAVRGILSIPLGKTNPFFAFVALDFSKEKILLVPHPDVASYRASGAKRAILEQLIIDEIAKIKRTCNEAVQFQDSYFEIPFYKSSRTTGLLAFHMEALAKAEVDAFLKSLQRFWHPQHPDLKDFSLVNSSDYAALPPEKRKAALIASAPVLASSTSMNFGKENGSLYAIVQGIGSIAQAYEEYPDSPLAKAFQEDLRALGDFLQRHGFFPHAFHEEGNWIFEKRDFLAPLLSATREEFSLLGNNRTACLELSDREQRILAENKIEAKIHEELVKWRDEYRSAQVNPHRENAYDIPKPPRSVFWSNLSFSFRKFFRGDERKILRWGLDLSGGKTVQIELRDANRQIVTSDADIKQAINELYQRVNKMGVSEVSIRQLGHQIALDFPGSQSFSASELIQASTMYFHVVNEQFSPENPILGGSVQRFLQEVWNEAMVTSRQEEQGIQEIAYRHLYGDDPSHPKSQSTAARTLFENGLQLQPPAHLGGGEVDSRLDTHLSKIALQRGKGPAEWHGQSHPLMIVFSHFALEGKDLSNIRSGYDPSNGNSLHFEVVGGSARASLYAWTSQYAADQIRGTNRETHSKGRGWRMAVLLNDTVVNAPALNQAIRDGGMISGHFSQREVHQLAADLKAGSLTFTPRILSEKNVSPELGTSDRMQGITASWVALFLVVFSMIAYYRFAGVVASVAVLFNLLILWAVLQNLGATLTLAGIAGIVLTVGMAVDANVLVFERVKEEFCISQNISSAIAAGYKKAFSAILDSNVTTIIAALILLNFDAGPIKSFAVNLIIGIASSMFTALFMTRFYFTGWAQTPGRKTLNMSGWLQNTSFDFLKRAKFAFVVAFAIIGMGSILFATRSAAIFGMDFTGGFALNLELEPTGASSYIADVERALVQSGIKPRDFQVRELTPAHHLRLLLSAHALLPLADKGREEKKSALYPFQKDPQIAAIVDALENADLMIAPASKKLLHQEWTAMSGQMSSAMRNQSLFGLFLSFLAIFIYLTFRFESKFAASALICLFHDVLITLGLVAILHALGAPLQIDLNTIAALMTIIGYSLNDTIIVFDRIREEMHLKKTKGLAELVNASLNATLSRTSITSGTTLLVLIALVLFGGPSLFSFSFVMTIGVIFGTLSSWFIASPLMLIFHSREAKTRGSCVS